MGNFGLAGVTDPQREFVERGGAGEDNIFLDIDR